MTNYTSIALEPRTTTDRIDRVEFVYIDEYPCDDDSYNG